MNWNDHQVNQEPVIILAIMLPMTTDQSEKADSGSMIETHEHIQPCSEYSIDSMKIQTQCPSEACMRRSACCVHPDHQMTQKSFLRSPLTSDVVIEGTHRISVRPVTACRTSSSKGQAPPLPGFGPCSDLPSTSDLIFLTFCSRPSMGPTGFCRLAFLRMTTVARTAPNWALTKSREPGDRERP